MGNCIRCRTLDRHSLGEDEVDFAGFGFQGFGGYSQFHMDAWHGDAEKVKSFLAGDKNLGFDVPTSDKNTPFALAAHGGHLEVFEILLNHGANVHNADHEKDTPLHYAVKNRSYEMTKKLLEHGADVNIKNNYNTTPLWLAVYKKDARLLKLLLFHYSEMSVCATGHRLLCHHEREYINPKSPLYVAVDRGATECVRVLLRAGCELQKEKWLLEADYPTGEEYEDYSEEEDESEDETEVEVAKPDKNTLERKEILAETIKMLRDLASRPPTLLAQCRTFLRKRLGKQLNDVISDFGLPSSLMEYLTLAEFNPEKNL